MTHSKDIFVMDKLFAPNCLKTIKRKILFGFFAIIASVMLIPGFSATLNAAPREFVTTANLNLRTGPSTNFERIELIQLGTVVTVINFDPYGFSEVRVNGLEGFVSSEFLEPLNPAEEITQVYMPVFFDEAPEYIEQEVYTEYVNEEPEQYIEEFTNENQTEEETLGPFVTTANLNLRTGPGADFERIVLLNAGTTLEVTFFDPYGFSAVNANGLSGFVSSEFIKPLETNPSFTNIAPAAVNGNVELLSWAEFRNVVPQNAILHITDVRSSRTYNVKVWSMGKHADVDPVTTNDTETLRATYGGKWSWDPRPVLVSYNGRTFAGAINGMPHGGSNTAGNGVNGHFCLHFPGSSTHNGNRSYEAHLQSAVMEAFNSSR